MDNKRKVLDHGFIRRIDHMGSDLSIVRNARVSYDAAWRAGEDEGSDIRLIRYLMKNKHNTPFESCTVTFEIKAPIFVIRQWHRHRTQSYNEISARYRELPEEFYVPELDKITQQSKDNKQMRTQEQHPFAEEIRYHIESTCKKAFVAYKQMIAQGCPRELARGVLPMNTYTNMFATANLHNWYGFLRERLHPHAQYEIRVYAYEILWKLLELFPESTKAFMSTLVGYDITKDICITLSDIKEHYELMKDLEIKFEGIFEEGSYHFDESWGYEIVEDCHGGNGQGRHELWGSSEFSGMLQTKQSDGENPVYYKSVYRVVTELGEFRYAVLNMSIASIEFLDKSGLLERWRTKND